MAKRYQTKLCFSITVLAMLILCLCVPATKADTVTTTQDFNLAFFEGQSFNYQDVFNSITVTFTATSGDLNGTAQLNTNDLSGSLAVNPSTTGTLTVNASVDTFYLYFNNVYFGAGSSGGSFNFTSGTVFAVSWTYNQALPPPIIPTSGTTTFYFRSDTYRFNASLAGYDLGLTNTNTVASVSEAGSGDTYFGFRVWILHQRGSLVELTSGVPVGVVSRVVDGAGYQSSYWTPSETSLVLGYDRLVVVTYQSDDGATWAAKVTSISHTLMSNRLYSSPWNFTVYTSLVSPTGTFSFGDSATANSRIEGVSLRVPLPQEMAIYYGTSGDFLNMVIFPYTYLIGNLIYSLVFLLIGGSFYLKNKKPEVLLILIVLFGSIQGSMFLLPSIVWRIVLIIIILVVTIVLYRLFR
jgi:hypothetical protein